MPSLRQFLFALIRVIRGRKGRNMKKPKARYEDIVVSDYRDELLLYDLKTHKCHSLNKTAASIWQACDGKRNVAAIAETLYADTTKESREELVELTLNELAHKELIAKGGEYEFRSLTTRRELIKKLGKVTLISLPIVASVTAPTVNQAQSGCPVVTTNPCNPIASIPFGCPCPPEPTCSASVCLNSICEQGMCVD